jgi:outer membrane protein OmpA-like peptidoglycan-associated protein
MLNRSMTCRSPINEDLRIMSTRLLWVMLLWSGFALAASDSDNEPLPPGTRIRILDIRQHVADFSRGLPPRGISASTQQLSGAGISVRESSQTIVIDLSADVLFDFDHADLRPTAQASLQKIAQFITARAKHNVRIEGHTDAKGSDAYNQKLSLARAESVHRWLVQRAALSSMDFTVTGRGASVPVAPNTMPDGQDDPVGRQKNRRVEITINRN